jgi:ketosteroid isomerase-like protein
MSQANVEIVRRLFEQWATGDLSADCFGPDIEYLRVGAKTPDMEGRWLGLDEVSTAMRDYLRAF